MRLRFGRAGLVLPAVLALALGAAPPIAVAGALPTAQYPSVLCPGTLQNCITSMAPDGVITIVTSSVITENLTVESGLTIRAGSGFTPAIAGDLAVVSSSGSVEVILERLAVQGQVRASLTGGAGHVVRLRHLQVTEATRDAIHLESTVTTTFEVSDSHVHTDGDGAAGVDTISVQTHHPVGTSTILLRGNHVDGTGNPDSGNGIFIGLENFDTGFTDVHVHNNRVFDVANCPGCDVKVMAGLWVNTEFAAVSDVDIVGNTFARSGVDGIILRALLDVAGGFTTMHLYDNIVSHSAHHGLRVTTDPARMLLDADYNDLFSNGDGTTNESGEPLGPHTLAVGPAYVDLAGGDLRLKATSPLIDAGLVCTPGQLAYIDAAGRRRVAGASVDLGAFERGAGPADGKVWFGTSGSDSRTGTNGADVLCGMGGKDVIGGAGGNDYIDGGTGGDTITGGTGADRLHGGPDNDLLCAKDGSGTDSLFGESGTDRFRADPGDSRTSVEQPGAC